MKALKKRKQQSIALLKEQGVPYIEHRRSSKTLTKSASAVAPRKSPGVQSVSLITIQLAWQDLSRINGGR